MTVSFELSIPLGHFHATKLRTHIALAGCSSGYVGSMGDAGVTPPRGVGSSRTIDAMRGVTAAVSGPLFEFSDDGAATMAAAIELSPGKHRRIRSRRPDCRRTISQKRMTTRVRESARFTGATGLLELTKAPGVCRCIRKPPQATERSTLSARALKISANLGLQVCSTGCSRRTGEGEVAIGPNCDR